MQEPSSTPGQLRMLTAIADSERSGMERSGSLPLLLKGSRTRLPTPASGRIDLAFPAISLGTSQSLSSLTGLANARQQRLQCELDRVVKRQHEHERPNQSEDEPATPRPGISSHALARARMRANLFDEMFEEIATIYEDAAAVRTPVTSSVAAVGVAAPAAESQASQARKKEERRRKHAAELSRMLAGAGRRVSKTRIAIDEKLAELREDEEARVSFARYCDSIRAKPISDIVERNIAALGGGPGQLKLRQAEQAGECRARRAHLREQQAGQHESISYIPHPTSHIPHPTSYTLQPTAVPLTSRTLYLTSYILHLTPHTALHALRLAPYPHRWGSTKR